MKISQSGAQTSRYNRLVTVFVALGSFVSPFPQSPQVYTNLIHTQTYGYCASIIASTIGQPGWYTYFDLPQQGEPGYVGKTTHTIATANGLFSGGGAVGSLFMMWSAEKFGRKRNIQLGCFLSVLGGVLQGGAATLA
jgi:MFS family permease